MCFYASSLLAQGHPLKPNMKADKPHQPGTLRFCVEQSPSHHWGLQMAITVLDNQNSTSVSVRAGSNVFTMKHQEQFPNQM